MSEDLEGTPYLPSDEVVSTSPVRFEEGLPEHLYSRYCEESGTWFTDPREHLELHAAKGEPCKTLGISYAKYMGTVDESGNETERPPEDTELRGWTAQQKHHK